MKKIIHISDLHFGAENIHAVEALLKCLLIQQPDVVVVSGDLTQRARRSQFLKAADFFNQIPFNKVIVPGNHDVPLFDVTRRFLAPFNRYIRYINADFFPAYIDAQMAIIGINTAYSFTWKSGRVTPNQIDIVQSKFKHEGEKLKMLVIHHPFHEIFFKDLYHKNLSDLGIDIIFSGHLHKASAAVLDNHVALLNCKTLLVQAGTAISNRLRGENNSFNMVEVISNNKLTISIWDYNNRQFGLKMSNDFAKESGTWRLA